MDLLYKWPCSVFFFQLYLRKKKLYPPQLNKAMCLFHVIRYTCTAEIVTYFQITSMYENHLDSASRLTISENDECLLCGQ